MRFREVRRVALIGVGDRGVMLSGTFDSTHEVLSVQLTGAKVTNNTKLLLEKFKPRCRGGVDRFGGAGCDCASPLEFANQASEISFHELPKLEPVTGGSLTVPLRHGDVKFPVNSAFGNVLRVEGGVFVIVGSDRNAGFSKTGIESACAKNILASESPENLNDTPVVEVVFVDGV